jgi:hypothetical protein
LLLVAKSVQDRSWQRKSLNDLAAGAKPRPGREIFLLERGLPDIGAVHGDQNPVSCSVALHLPIIVPNEQTS